MSSAFRPGSFLDRIATGKEARGVPPIDPTQFTTTPGMRATFKPQQSLRAYGDNVWLYRAVLSIAMEIGATDFKLRRPKGDNEFETITKHQALATLKRPQPTKSGKSMLTGMLLKIITGMHMMLNGESFWLLDKRLKMGGAPTFVRPLLSQNMELRLDMDGEVVEYIYRLQSREYRLDPFDVVHFRLPDPENPYRGHSPVQGIRYAVDTQKEADVMNFKRLMNNAVPTGIITTKTQVNHNQIELIKGQWNQMYRGADNAGRTAVVPEGMDFKSVQQSNQEMQYAEGKQATRDEILAAYGVGLEIIGQTDSVTRANAEATIFVFERFGVSPFLKLINDTLCNDFLVAFPHEEGTEFYYDDPVPENMEEKRQTAKLLFDSAALSPDGMLQMFGKEPLNIPGVTDVPYAGSGLLPAGEMMDTEEEEEEVPDEL